jgi:class 3 adenylate cyclase
MTPILASPLANIEHQLRKLLPADLYAEIWLDPSPRSLARAFQHLRTLQRILYNYTPRQLAEVIPTPGELRHEWQQGTLMFTDLAGFTPLMEANASQGREGAEALLTLLNRYFATMLEIISKSGGNLLEFTGDALLVQFPMDALQSDTLRAVRAAFRMQRAMEAFRHIETSQGVLSLGMRIGVHTGKFLTAEIGTPQRMEHVLMGAAVQRTKRAEGAGTVGRLCMTPEAYEKVQNLFAAEPTQENHLLLIDDYHSDQELGGYEIALARRMSTALMTDASMKGVLRSIGMLVGELDALSSYLPPPILELLVETASKRKIAPQFARPVILFVNIAGIPQSADHANPEETIQLLRTFSRTFALINAAAQSRGGYVKKVTYHLYGSDAMLIFGVPAAHSNDPARAASAALAIQGIMHKLARPTINGQEMDVFFQMGMAVGSVFAAEIGDPRGRREFNVLGDAVNTAARLMVKAGRNEIWMTAALYQEIQNQFVAESLGTIQFKGKSTPTPVYALKEGIGDQII